MAKSIIPKFSNIQTSRNKFQNIHHPKIILANIPSSNNPFPPLMLWYVNDYKIIGNKHSHSITQHIANSTSTHLTPGKFRAPSMVERDMKRLKQYQLEKDTLHDEGGQGVIGWWDIGQNYFWMMDVLEVISGCLDVSEFLDDGCCHILFLDVGFFRARYARTFHIVLCKTMLDKVFMKFSWQLCNIYCIVRWLPFIMAQEGHEKVITQQCNFMPPP